MILIKEEFVGGEKWRRAVKLGGSDAIALWLAMKCYCSLHPDTVGFVPAEGLDELPGAPRRTGKALQALLECGRLLPGGARGAGLVEPAEGGWRLHDYLDHSASPEEIELRREKQRLKKQTYRESKRRELAAVRRFAAETAELGDPPLLAHPLGEGTCPPLSPGDMGDNPGDTDGDNPGDTAGDNGETSLAGAGPREGVRPPAPVRASAQPSPALPNPAKKSLQSLSSEIRSARASLGGVLARVEACPAHRRIAAAHGIELEPLLDELRAAPDVGALSADQIRDRIGAMLEQRTAIGGAA